MNLLLLHLVEVNLNNDTKTDNICNLWGKCIATPSNTNRDSVSMQSDLIGSSQKLWQFIWYNQPFAGVSRRETLLINGFGKCLAPTDGSAKNGLALMAVTHDAIAINEWTLLYQCPIITYPTVSLYDQSIHILKLFITFRLDFSSSLLNKLLKSPLN